MAKGQSCMNVYFKKTNKNSLLFVSVYLYVMLTDQTPTPTRFLQNCEEVGLFKEIEEEFLQAQEEEKSKQVLFIETCKPKRSRIRSLLAEVILKRIKSQMKLTYALLMMFFGFFFPGRSGRLAF